MLPSLIMMKAIVSIIIAGLIVLPKQEALACLDVPEETYFETRVNQFEQRQLNANEIHYEVFGENNSDVLVLIHGLDSASGTFYNVTEELAKRYKVIVYDQKGHGRTIDLGVDFSSSALAKDLKVLLDHLGIQKAHILGHSMGARTATQFADLFPSMVRSLIIEDMELYSRASLPKVGKTQVDAHFELYANLKEKFEGKIFQNREVLTRALKPYFGRESKSLTYRRAVELDDGRFKLLFRPWVSIQYGLQGNLEDFSLQLQRLKVPLLVMQADSREGTALSSRGVKHIKENAPSAEVVFFKDTGHTIHRKNVEKFLSVLLDFLK